MSNLTITASPRVTLGKKVKTLRKQGILPANLYGHAIQSEALQLDAHAFSLLLRRMPANAILNLQVAGEPERAVMIHRTQRNVRTGLPSHIELFQINMLEKMTVSVPLVLVGESDLVRRGEATVLQEMTHLEISCLPGDVPRTIEVHVDRLVQTGDAITVADLEIDRTKIEVKSNETDRVAGLTGARVLAEAAAEAAESAAEATAS